MAGVPEIPGGELAAWGAGLFGAVFASLRMWKEFSKTSTDIAADKRLETAATAAHARISSLENIVQETQKALNAAERQLGCLEGQLAAERAKSAELEKYRGYWRERTLVLETENEFHEKCVDWFTAKVQQQSFEIAVLKGHLPLESLILEPIGPMPRRESSPHPSSVSPPAPKIPPPEKVD